ncbi:MAG: HDOD domain-containing protein, partial [Desulfobacteraceae bacterium]
LLGWFSVGRQVVQFMKLIKKMRRHAAMASGNFNSMFKGVEIPSLPVAVQRLICEINKDDPDIGELTRLISSTTGIAAKVIKTVNSSFYSPRSPVTEIKQAVMFLGIENIRSLSMAYAAMESIPKPKGSLFDHEAFWIDSLLRAFLSRSFAGAISKEAAEEAFTASLISDIALPVLLSAWSEYYAPVIAQWRQSPKRLSQLERAQFGWDHAQAGAYIVQSWEFPDELVCYIGAHNLSLDEIKSLELDDTIVVPMAVAAQSSSILKPDAGRNRAMYGTALTALNLTPADYAQMITMVKNRFNGILSLFGLSNRGADDALDQMASAAQPPDQECRA